MGDRSLLDPVLATSYTGSRTTLTDGTREMTTSVWIDERDRGTAVDAVSVDCHGGWLRMSWYIGNLEPQVPSTGIHMTVRLDGHPIATSLRGSTMGNWNDAPASILAVAPCSTGSHVVDLEIASITGRWGFPYVVTLGSLPEDGYRVPRGFILQEVWGD
jgi:hypothetical protein